MASSRSHSSPCKRGGVRIMMRIQPTTVCGNPLCGVTQMQYRAVHLRRIDCTPWALARRPHKRLVPCICIEVDHPDVPRLGALEIVLHHLATGYRGLTLAVFMHYCQAQVASIPH